MKEPGDSQSTPTTNPGHEPILHMRRAEDRLKRLSDHLRPDCPTIVHSTRGPSILVQYLVASAAIAVLIVTYQQWRVLKHLDSVTTQTAPLINDLINRTANINATIKDEHITDRERLGEMMDVIKERKR